MSPASAPPSATITFRVATAADREEMAALINSAYRGESSRAGWTTEEHLLDGLRTDAGDLGQIMSKPGSAFVLAIGAGRIVGTVLLEKRPGGICYLGMLTVAPHGQAQGLGREILAEAERFARERYGARKMEMTVITLRHELIAWYERRGYRRTGRLEPFPVHERFGLLKPEVSQLEFETLEKAL